MFAPRARGIRVGHRTRAQIRAQAEFARDALELPPGPPNMAQVLEHNLSSLGILYSYEPPHVMGAAEALAIPEQNTILLREDVYFALLEDDPPARFTVAHEVGHLWLHERPGPATALYHAEPARPHGPLEDAECQADAFAAEFLAPAREFAGMRVTAAGLMHTYNLSFQAAMQRVRELSAEGIIRR